MKAHAIIKQVIREHHLAKEDFFGRDRTAYLVRARKDAAQRLAAEQYSPNQIGRLIKRDHSTIRNYLCEDYRERHGVRYGNRRVLQFLTPVAKATVIEAADLQNTSPERIVAQWINERVGGGNA